MYHITKMRVPTCDEMSHAAKVTCKENDIMHWKYMSSWCRDTDQTSDLASMCCGYHDPCYCRHEDATFRHFLIGFRPALEVEPRDLLEPDGSVVVVGTLFMDGMPVRIPQNPVWDGDIQDYVPGAALEMRNALDDPAYQVQAIKAGDILLADRVLLKNISYVQTSGSLPLFFVTLSNESDSSRQVIAAARSRDYAWVEMYRAFIKRLTMANCGPLPSEGEALEGWEKAFGGIYASITEARAVIKTREDASDFSISEFALDQNLLF